MLNRTILIGRLTKDPELRYTQNGTAVCTFSLAVDRGYKNAEGKSEVDFIDINVWRKQGENCANYLSKGKMVAIDGRLETSTYKDKNGNSRKEYHVVADNVRFLSAKSAEESNTATPAQVEPPPIEDDELPF